jgi:hypothetical protein
MTIDLRGSYFAISNPLTVLARWLNPYRHHEIVILNSHELEVRWTRRVNNALQRRSRPLFVEMRLYFSCVVQKRVLFHHESNNDHVAVNEQLLVCFHPVEALSCDPEQFAKNHPVKRQLSSRAASRMYPARLLLDYTKGQWHGEFSI